MCVDVSFLVAISHFSPIEYEHISKTVSSLNLVENKWVVHLENMKPENQQVSSILVLLILYLSACSSTYIYPCICPYGKDLDPFIYQVYTLDRG